MRSILMLHHTTTYGSTRMSNDKPFSIDENKPTDWFEPLYAGSNTDGEGVPWANMGIHPAFDGWLKDHPLDGAGKRALVVGCGMGDDAIELEKRGFAVTAFDVADSAIRPHSAVESIPDDKNTPTGTSATW